MAIKNSKQFYTVKCEVKVPFYGYDTNRKNIRARKQIKNWIKSALVEHCAFIPMYVEEDESVSYIEDCSQHTRIKTIK